MLHRSLAQLLRSTATTSHVAFNSQSIRAASRFRHPSATHDDYEDEDEDFGYGDNQRHQNQHRRKPIGNAHRFSANRRAAPGAMQRGQFDESYGQRYRAPNANMGFNERVMQMAGESLRPIDWSEEELQVDVTDVYEPHQITADRSEEEIKAYYAQHTIKMSGKNAPKPILTFEEANFPAKVTESLLKEYVTPTVIQSVSWPALMQGHDFIGISKTGSGKTLSFLLPALVRCLANQTNGMTSPGCPQVLIMCPTRELAQQVFHVSLSYQKLFHHRSICLFGGVSKAMQSQRLSDGFIDVVIATPGRLLDLLEEGMINLRECNYLVLDEADRMLDMGFEPQIRRVLSQIRPNRQTGMFTATWPEEVRQLASDFMRSEHTTATIGSQELSANTNITQNIHVLEVGERKFTKLGEILLEEMARPKAKVLLFVNTKRTADYLSDWLYQHYDYPTASLHGNHTQRQRDTVMQGFRQGRIRLLIATDVAARGIDVSDISCVVNVDYPNRAADYVHRIGRTGRNQPGVAHTLIEQGDPLTGPSQVAELIGVLEESNQEVPEELQKMAYKRKGSSGSARGFSRQPSFNRRGGGGGGGGGRPGGNPRSSFRDFV